MSGREELLVAVVATAATFGWQLMCGRIAARRSRAAELGATVRIPCRLRGTGEEHPPRYRNGQLILKSTSVWWRSRWAWGPKVFLTAITSVHLLEVVRRSRDPRADRTVFVCRWSSGESVHLSCPDRYRVGVAAALRRARDMTEPEARDRAPALVRITMVVPVWAVMVLVLFSASAALWTRVVVAGTSRTASVTVPPDPRGSCRVRWMEPETVRPAEGNVICPLDARTGDLVKVHVGPPPFDVVELGGMGDLAFTLVGLPGSAALVAIGVTGWNVFQRRRVRAGGLPDGGDPMWRCRSHGLFPAADDATGYTAAATIAGHRGRKGSGFVRWLLSPPMMGATGRPLGRSWWREPILRLPFLAAVVTTSLVTAAGVVLATVMWHSLPWTAGVTATAVGSLFVFWVGGSARAARMRFEKVRTGSGSRLRYVLCFTDYGRPVLILYPSVGDDAPPVGMIPVSARAVRAYEPAVTGALTLHGAPEPGELAVPVVKGCPLWPDAPLRPARPETVHWLVNGGRVELG